MPDFFRKYRWRTGRTLIILFFLLTVFASPAFAQDFTINKFRSDIVIFEDSSFTVKETVEVDFHRPRHGIYREIPFKYVNEPGKTITTPLEVLSVTNQSGINWKYKVSRSGNVINIRIGDADKYVSGKQTYVINYKVENALLYFDDHDEIYWNVTGNYWKATIKKASATVLLAAEGKSEKLQGALYTGIPGARESAGSFEVHDNYGEFSAAKSLAPGEGLTIAFGWDKGLVSPPSSWKKFLWALNLKENWVFVFPIISLLFMIYLWRTKGRDPRVKESVAVMYKPPEYDNRPLAPAEVGTIVDEKLDPRDITSTIVGLAVKKYIKIEEIKREGLLFDSTDYYLSKIKEPDDDLSSFEKELMKRILPYASPGILVSNMKNDFYTNLDSLKNTLYGELVRKKYFLTSPEKVRGFYTAAGIAVMIFGILALIFLAPHSAVKSILAGALTGLPVLLCARIMPAKTRTGAGAHMDILGFREFLNRAEKDRLERMGDADLFSKFLPYAIALGVADNWAKAFEGIYQKPPEWYVSPGGFATFSPYGFSRSINAATASFASAMFSAPRGSGIGSGTGGGFSGGRFSGGGFGGGGGGSW